MSSLHNQFHGTESWVTACENPVSLPSWPNTIVPTHKLSYPHCTSVQSCSKTGYHQPGGSAWGWYAWTLSGRTSKPYSENALWNIQTVEGPVTTPTLVHTLPELWIHSDGTRSFPCIQKWHKTVSLFKNWNAPKIECWECLYSYNLGKHLPPLCGKRGLFRILPLIWGKDKSVRTFCCECISSQEGIFSSLEFWMYEKWIFFSNKEFSTKDQQGSWKRLSQSSIPVPFPYHGSSLSGYFEANLCIWVLPLRTLANPRSALCREMPCHSSL